MGNAEQDRAYAPTECSLKENQFCSDGVLRSCTLGADRPEGRSRWFGPAQVWTQTISSYCLLVLEDPEREGLVSWYERGHAHYSPPASLHPMFELLGP